MAIFQSSWLCTVVFLQDTSLLLRLSDLSGCPRLYLWTLRLVGQWRQWWLWCRWDILCLWGRRISIRCRRCILARMGHNLGRIRDVRWLWPKSDLSSGTILLNISDFCHPNWIETEWAMWRRGCWSCGILYAPILKIISHALIGLVFWSFLWVFEYSQDLMQKNMDPARDDALAFSRAVIAIRRSCLYTSRESAFWCLVGGSTSL